MAISIDPAAKRIVLDGTSVTATAIYAAWVDWAVLSDNLKYLPAFSSVGGDDLGEGLSIPPYYFLLNGWKVRPMEANQTLVVTGNLFVSGGGDPIAPTLGSYNVLVKSVVPVQAQGIATGGSSGPSADSVATAVWQAASRTLTDPGVAQIVAALLSTLQATTIPVNVKKVNDTTISGTGVEGDTWGPA